MEYPYQLHNNGGNNDNNGGGGRQSHNAIDPERGEGVGGRIFDDDDDDIMSTTGSSFSTDSESRWKQHFNFDSMTSEEIAIWIDVKARIIFPVLFVVFNILYWCFAFRVDCELWKDCGEDDSSYEF